MAPPSVLVLHLKNCFRISLILAQRYPQPCISILIAHFFFYSVWLYDLAMHFACTTHFYTRLEGDLYLGSGSNVYTGMLEYPSLKSYDEEEWDSMYIVRHVRHANECEQSKIIITITLRERYWVFEVAAVLNMSSSYELCSGTRDCSLCILSGYVVTFVPKVSPCLHVRLSRYTHNTYPR